MSNIADTDKKVRALIDALVKTSQDCPASNDCDYCLMQTVGGGCGSILLRNHLGSIRFRRD